MSDTDSQTEEPQGRTYYDVLGVPTSADRDSVRIAYRTRMVELQADAWRGAESDRRAEAARVNDAWNTLSDPFQRDRYDALLEEGAAPLLPDAPSDRPVGKNPRRVGPQVKNAFVAGSGPVPEGTTAVLANRINAIIFDLMLGAVGYAVFGFLVFNVFGEKAAAGKISAPKWFVPALTAWVLAELVLIFVVTTARSGQTIGQRLFGVQVVIAATGEHPGLTRTLYRYGPLIILVLAGLAIEPLMMLLPFFLGLSFLVTKAKRGFPDIAARTVVVDAEPRPPRFLRRKSAG
jgi:uncharacterized RDD family membrane protein YckC